MQDSEENVHVDIWVEKVNKYDQGGCGFCTVIERLCGTREI